MAVSTQMISGKVGGTLTSAALENEAVIRVNREGSVVNTPNGGFYQERAVRGKIWSGTRAAATIPVNATTLVSVFGLYNPPGSGVLLELIDIDLVNVLATTVVNGYGLYFSASTNATGATFTTRGTEIEGRPGDGTLSSGRFYTAVTHVGTPVLWTLVGGHGATTNAGAAQIHKDFKGAFMIPPSTLVSLAATTAASTASGMTASITWAEIPFIAAA